MPLGEPPAPAELSGLRARRLAGSTLFRVFTRRRSTPWWFSSLGADTLAGSGGRFDLPAPGGSCYTATTLAAALLEAFQSHSRGLVPATELEARQAAEILCPQRAPAAAALTASAARGAGVTAALWAGPDRALTQRWAVALHRGGWRAITHGIQHDPTGRLRGVTLFDTAGEHPPFDDQGWHWSARDLAGDATVSAVLARYGLQVERSDVQLPVVALEDLP